jgi:hypothetical protein
VIIMNQGVVVTIPDDAEWRYHTNGGGNCVALTAVTLPPGHSKYGRGPAVALRDTEDPDGPVLIFTAAEIKCLGIGIGNGAFDGLI